MPASAATEMFTAKGGDKVYAALVKGLRSRVGKSLAFEDPKSTCIHINAGKDGAAYAGLHPRTGGVLLNIRTAAPIKSKRIRRSEQVSRNRCHCEVLLSSADDVDDEVLGWLEDAARLASEPKATAAKK